MTCHQRNVRLCWSFLFFRAEKRGTFLNGKKGSKGLGPLQKKKHWLCAGTCFEHSRGKECINFFLSSFFSRALQTKSLRASIGLCREKRKRKAFFLHLNLGKKTSFHSNGILSMWVRTTSGSVSFSTRKNIVEANPSPQYLHAGQFSISRDIDRDSDKTDSFGFGDTVIAFGTS